MSIALAERDLRFLQDYGFSEKQAEGILSVTKSQVKELVEKSAQKQAEKIKEKMVTKEYLDLQAENIKKTLVIQVGGVVLSGLLLLGWYISHLDSKTRAYVDARFSAQDQRFDEQNRRFNERFDEQNRHFDERFDEQNRRFENIESDLKELKQEFKELKEVVQKAIK